MGPGFCFDSQPHVIYDKKYQELLVVWRTLEQTNNFFLFPLIRKKNIALPDINTLCRGLLLSKCGVKGFGFRACLSFTVSINVLPPNLAQ